MIQNKKNYSLSVIVITKNEADRIEDCLASVSNIADEIIVLDSGSSDNTVELVSKFTENVFVTDWPGFGKQKQRALDKASCEWVLSLDADEVVTEALKNEIHDLLSNDPSCSGYMLRWAEFFLGKQLNFGSRSSYILRLFKRDLAIFSDWIVHEKVLLKEGESTGVLHNRLTHYSVRNFEHMMSKYNLYASLAAKKRFKKNVHGGGLIGAAARAVFVFVNNYVLRLGFLDGGPGFLIAVMQSQYSFNKYAGLWALRRINLNK